MEVGGRAEKPGTVKVGISGYDYKPWRGPFYPDDLPARRWLEYASREFPTIELNGTFYSLKSPSVFEKWVVQTPDDFVFAIKGGRFITHNLKLRNCDSAMGNFFASGVLGLGRKTGPFLWQLPATYGFDAERMDSFMAALPRNSREGERVASMHDYRLRRGVLLESAGNVDYRHAFEVRHDSYFCDEFFDILRKHSCGFVIADTGGKFPYSEEITSDFVYVRLHGPGAIYASKYSEADLELWARKIKLWAKGGRDVYVYFDNDIKAYAPFDALRLMDLLRAARKAKVRRAV